MANVAHTYEEIVEILSSLVGQKFRTAAQSEFFLASTENGHIIVERRKPNLPVQIIDLTIPIKQIVEKINAQGFVTKEEIKQGSRIGNTYPITTRAICEKTNLIKSVTRGNTWNLQYIEYDALENLNGKSMLNGFLVQNYKNISSLQIEDLKQLNLFVGANNVGKSNLLEAISLYVTGFSPKRMMEILEIRHENLEYFDEKYHYAYIDDNAILEAFSPFLPHRDINFLINNNTIILGENDKKQIGLRLRTAVYRDDRDLSRLVQLNEYNKLTTTQQFANTRDTVLVSAPYSAETSRGAQSSNFGNILHMIKLKRNGIEIPNSLEKNLYRFEYVNCKRLTTENIEDLWAKYSMTKMEDLVSEALKTIDERIKRFNFVKIDSHTYAPFVQLLEDDEATRMPISEMGDGMTHILNIIMALLACENGILLLDEAESGLHYRTQIVLWTMMNKLAKDFHVQIFATTHSLDCVRAFALSTTNDMGRIMRLEKQDNNVVVRSYKSVENVADFINDNIEIR